MRIWHEKLISILCRQHLLAMWREGLGAYSIIAGNKKGYSNHPTVKEFRYNTLELKIRLEKVRKEMIKRGYHPKELPWSKYNFEFDICMINSYKWQTLNQQIEILKSKKCECKV